MEGSIGRVTWSQAMNNRPVLSDLTVPDSGPLAPSTIARLPSLDITKEEASQLGYMPLRDDFERVCFVFIMNYVNHVNILN